MIFFVSRSQSNCTAIFVFFKHRIFLLSFISQRGRSTEYSAITKRGQHYWRGLWHCKKSKKQQKPRRKKRKEKENGNGFVCQNVTVL